MLDESNEFFVLLEKVEGVEHTNRPLWKLATGEPKEGDARLGERERERQVLYTFWFPQLSSRMVVLVQLFWQCRVVVHKRVRCRKLK